MGQTFVANSHRKRWSNLVGITKRTAHHIQAADDILALSPSLNSLSSRFKSYPLLSTSGK